MAKPKEAGKAKEEKYPYPSHYGSHQSMVVDVQELNEKELEQYVADLGVVTEGRVVCKDEFGYYATTPKRIQEGDQFGCHDSYRTAAWRMKGDLYKSMIINRDKR